MPSERARATGPSDKSTSSLSTGVYAEELTANQNALLVFRFSTTISSDVSYAAVNSTGATVSTSQLQCPKIAVLYTRTAE